MGGAGFPTHVKLSPKEPEKIDYVIANCAECEPYLTSDYRRMLPSTTARLIATSVSTLLTMQPASAGRREESIGGQQTGLYQQTQGIDGKGTID